MKKEKKKLGSIVSNSTVLLFNIGIALVCIAAILSLMLGEFWSFTFAVHADKETMKQFTSSEESSSESEDGLSGLDFNTILDNMKDDQSLDFEIGLSLSGPALTQAAFGNGEEVFKEMISEQTDKIFTQLDGLLDTVIDVAVNSIVNVAVNEAKETIKNSIKEEMSKEMVSDEEVSQKMQEKYGVSEEDLDTLSNELSDSIEFLLDGDEQKTHDAIANSETLAKLTAIYAEQELKNDPENAGKETFSQEELDAKAAELKKEIVDGFDDVITEAKEAAGTETFDKDSLVIAIANQSGLFSDENGNATEIKSKDELKAALMGKITSSVDEETLDYVALVLSFIGYYMFFIVATWLYLLIKLIIKTLCFKNKTVNMGLPRAFGWMPHVFLVGLPNLLLIFAKTYLTQLTEQYPDFADVAKLFTDGSVQLNVGSMTWISALCTVVLLVIAIFYRPIRKRCKEKK